MKKILLTGFTPFGGEEINPSYEAVRLLPDTIGDFQIIKAELPTVFRKGAQTLEQHVQEHNPVAVICIGQAGGRAAINVERVAINLQDARSPDNEGNCPGDEPIIPGGRTVYFSNLPTRAMVQSLQEHGIPAVLSYTAGTYVCNDVMYHLLSWTEERYPRLMGGFIHVPYAPGQVANMAAPQPSMPISTITQGLQLAVRAVINALEA